MSDQLDDRNLRPRPKCERCRAKVACWVVTINGEHFKRVLVCTGCARSPALRAGRRRAMHAQDY